MHSTQHDRDHLINTFVHAYCMRFAHVPIAVVVAGQCICEYRVDNFAVQ